MCFDLEKINDTVGHLLAISCSISLGGRLENPIRKNMIAFRLGGDEFAVIIEADLPGFHFGAIVVR